MLTATGWTQENGEIRPVTEFEPRSQIRLSKICRRWSRSRGNPLCQIRTDPFAGYSREMGIFQLSFLLYTSRPRPRPRPRLYADFGLRPRAARCTSRLLVALAGVAHTHLSVHKLPGSFDQWRILLPRQSYFIVQIPSGPKKLDNFWPRNGI